MSQPLTDAELELLRSYRILNWAQPDLLADAVNEIASLRAMLEDAREEGAMTMASGEELIERTAQLIAHRCCIGAEHNPQQGKLHGFCIVCGEPWPCAYAGKPPKESK